MTYSYEDLRFKYWQEMEDLEKIFNIEYLAFRDILKMVDQSSVSLEDVLASELEKETTQTYDSTRYDFEFAILESMSDLQRKSIYCSILSVAEAYLKQASRLAKLYFPSLKSDSIKLDGDAQYYYSFIQRCLDGIPNNLKAKNKDLLRYTTIRHAIIHHNSSTLVRKYPNFKVTLEQIPSIEVKQIMFPIQTEQFIFINSEVCLLLLEHTKDYLYEVFQLLDQRYSSFLRDMGTQYLPLVD